MDYFPGTTLEDLVKEKGVLEVEEALPLATQVGEALEAAHGRGILHRDVKPANLLVRRTDRGWDARLIDFGLAVKQEVLESAKGTSRQGKTIAGNSIAGT